MTPKASINSTMAELVQSTPWRDAPQDGDKKFQNTRLKVTSRASTMPAMHVPGKKVYNSKTDATREDSLTEIDPELPVKPLPSSMAYNVSCNLTFFTRIFTQFFDPDGIADAQKSLGLGQGERFRKVL